MFIIVKKCFTLSQQNAKFMSNIVYKLSTAVTNHSQFQCILLNKNDDNKLISKKLHLYANQKYNAIQGIQENISAFQMKKRPLRRKKIIIDDEEAHLPGVSV